MPDDDLLNAALRACDSYWMGSDRSKIDLRQAMTDLRCTVHAEQKKRAQADTTTIIKGQEFQ